MDARFRESLVQACQTAARPPGGSVTVPEPYIPHVPDGWTGTLVLAEAQNHSRIAGDYVTRLLALAPRDRILRLGFLEDLGVHPWDDGHLKLAVNAVFDLLPEEVAVSNAVLWSCLSASGANASPPPPLVTLSARLWATMLTVLRPTRIVTAGRVAERVVRNARRLAPLKFHHVVWPLPSPRVLKPVAGFLYAEDLMAHYPVVATAWGSHREWVVPSAQATAVFYACLATSATCQNSA